jgi:hypothetical protein
MKKSILSISMLISFNLFFTPIIAQEDVKDKIEKLNYNTILDNPNNLAGYTEFNVEDRMAVKNLLSAYCMTYDEKKIDQCADLFWSELEFTAALPNREAINLDKNGWQKTMLERARVFREQGIQSRHVLGEVMFLEENDKIIHTVNNGLAVRAIQQKDTRSLPMLYETWFEKRNETWKIIKFKIILDAVIDVESEVKE